MAPIVSSVSFGRLLRRNPPIQDNLHVLVILKALDEQLVQIPMLSRNDEQVPRTRQRDDLGASVNGTDSVTFPFPREAPQHTRGHREKCLQVALSDENSPAESFEVQRNPTVSQRTPPCHDPVTPSCVQPRTGTSTDEMCGRVPA